MPGMPAQHSSQCLGHAIKSDNMTYTSLTGIVSEMVVLFSTHDHASVFYRGYSHYNGRIYTCAADNALPHAGPTSSASKRLRWSTRLDGHVAAAHVGPLVRRLLVGRVPQLAARPQPQADLDHRGPCTGTRCLSTYPLTLPNMSAANAGKQPIKRCICLARWQAMPGPCSPQSLLRLHASWNPATKSVYTCECMEREHHLKQLHGAQAGLALCM